MRHLAVVGRHEPSPWNDALTATCRRHPDLVSVHESPQGHLALLLRRPLRPVAARRAEWLREILSIGAAVIADLRADGVRQNITLLQLRPAPEVSRMLHRWRCRYTGSPERLRELIDMADHLAADRGHIVTLGLVRHVPGRNGTAGPRHPVRLEEDVTRWYGDMASCWLNIEPIRRRQLVLRVHVWIAGSVFGGAARSDPVDDLVPEGRLASALAGLLTATEAQIWRPWIRLVLHDLRRALRWSPERRTEDWCRWLFLIPYSVPVLSAPATPLAVVASPRDTVPSVPAAPAAAGLTALRTDPPPGT